MSFFIEGMQKGGFFMWPILACAIFAVAICFERIFVVFFRANVNASAFFAQVQRAVMAGGLDRAIQLCAGLPDSALARVVKAGLTRANLDDEDVRAALDESILEVSPILQKRTAYLGMLANVATLLGLLGTIQGLIQAFDAVATASAEAKQSLLAAGIATAMYTTFAGLLVAIPTLVALSLVTAQTNRMLDELDWYAAKTVSLLRARRRVGAFEPPPEDGPPPDDELEEAERAKGRVG